MAFTLIGKQETSAGPLVPLLQAREIPPCGILSGREGSCLVLSLRHLGDAVIGAGVINSLQRHNPNMAIDVLGRPGLEEVIRTFSPTREYIGVEFPIFGHHRRDPGTLATTWRTVRMVRKRKYDFCINLIGDTRENAIGILTGAKWNVAPVWESGHLFKRKMTDTGAARLTNCGIVIPAIHANFYESMQYFTRRLGLGELERRSVSDRKRGADEGVTVALHPGASHPSRHWPEDKWRVLIRELHGRGYNIKMLGARGERDLLLARFGREISDHDIELVTEDVPRFVSCLAATDVLIGMDSFSVHAAYAVGVPIVVLNGSADPSILTPPGGMVTSAGHLCKQYPCYYKYPCQGTGSEYVCVRGIEVSAVLNALDGIIERGRGCAGDAGSGLTELFSRKM